MQVTARQQNARRATRGCWYSEFRGKKDTVTSSIFSRSKAGTMDRYGRFSKLEVLTVDD
jgi:hypothetical protein